MLASQRGVLTSVSRRISSIGKAFLVPVVPSVHVLTFVEASSVI